MFLRRIFFITLPLVLLWISLSLADNHDSASARVSADQNVDILPTSARLLGQDQQNGVMARAWLYRNRPSDQLLFPEIKNPYILFLRFRTIESDRPIEKGLVAYKIEYMNGDKTPAREMDLRRNYFIAGLDPGTAGFYVLHIGSKLEDEKKRQFRFDFSVR